MDKTLTEVYPILKLILETFGPWGTVSLILMFYFLLFGWRRYNEYVKEKEVNVGLAEKEKTIQRLANEVRMWRIIDLKNKHNWTDDQIERFLITEEFPDPKAARTYFSGVRNKREGKKNDG